MLAARTPRLGIGVLLLVLAATLGVVAAEPASVPDAVRVRELLEHSAERDNVVGVKDAKQALEQIVLPEAELVEFLLGRDEPLRHFAFGRLASLPRLSPATAARLTAAIEEGTCQRLPYVTEVNFRNALYLFIRFPRDAAVALPPLRALVGQPELPASSAAVLALMRIDPAGPEEWLRIVQRDFARFTKPAVLLYDPRGLAGYLSRCGQPVDAILAAQLNGTNGQNRLAALTQCARWGSRESLYLLAEAQYDADPVVRKLAGQLLSNGVLEVHFASETNNLTRTCAALDGIRNGTADALSLLAAPQALNSVVQEAAAVVAYGCPDTRRAALCIFRDYGMLATAGEPLLREAYLRNPDNIEAAAALLEIGWADDAAFQPYRALENSHDRRLRVFEEAMAVAREALLPPKTPIFDAKDPYARQMESLLFRTWSDRGMQPLHADQWSRAWMNWALPCEPLDITEWAIQGAYLFRGLHPQPNSRQRESVTLEHVRTGQVPMIKSRFTHANSGVVEEAPRYVNGYEYRFRAEFAALLPELRQLLVRADDRDADAALQYLSLIGESARPAIPEAVARYRQDPDRLGDALAAFASQLDDAGREALWVEMSKPATTGTDPKVAATRDRWRERFALRTDEARDRFVAALTVPQLFANITHEDYPLRLRVLRRLAALDGDARKQATQTLVDQLDKVVDYGPWQEQLRGNATLWLLGEYGADSRAALGRLEQLALGQRLVSVNAAFAALKIGSTRPQELVRMIVKATTDRSAPGAWVRHPQLSVPVTDFWLELQKIGPSVSLTLPDLLQTGTGTAKVLALQFLALVPQPSERALRAAVDALIDKDDAVARTAREALVRIGLPARACLVEAAAGGDEFRSFFAKTILEAEPFRSAPP